MKLYNELAEYYFEIEKTGRKFDEEIKFFHSIFKKHKIKIALDIGCGTGEHIIALQKLGYEMTGIDSSNAMIQVAKKRFSEGKFFKGEMQDFKLKHHSDAILCIYGTFNYMLTDFDINQSFESIRANLKTSGLVVLEIWNSYPIQKIKRKAMSPVSLSKIGDVLIQRNRGFKMNSKTEEKTGKVENLVEVNFQFHLDKEEIKDKHLMRVFSFDEMKSFLEKNKFELLYTFSNYNMDKFTEKAGRMILVAQKKV